MMSNWTKEELMICAAADVIQDHDVALVGIGLPTLAAMVAKQTNAPNLQMIFESGAIDAVPSDLPQGPGDFPLLRTSVMTTSLFNALGYVQRGKVDVAFLGAAEIDQYGNLNATVIGDYDRPVCRLPGSGGANDMGSGVTAIEYVGIAASRSVAVTEALVGKVIDPVNGDETAETGEGTPAAE